MVFWKNISSKVRPSDCVKKSEDANTYLLCELSSDVMGLADAILVCIDIRRKMAMRPG